MKVLGHCHCALKIIAPLRKPRVTVNMREINGQVERTGVYTASTLAMRQALTGVLCDFAKARKIYLLRLKPTNSGGDTAAGQAIEIAVGIETSCDPSPIRGWKRRQRGV